MNVSAPTQIRLRRKARILDVTWSDGVRFELPCEYLRVFSPSAELYGHGLQEPMLVGGKREVNISRIEPVGRYAVKLVFDDGHDSGIFSWEILRALGEGQTRNWARYLARLDAHGMSRDSSVVKLSALVGKWAPPDP